MAYNAWPNFDHAGFNSDIHYNKKKNSAFPSPPLQYFNPISPGYYHSNYDNPMSPQDYHFKYDNPISPKYCRFNRDNHPTNPPEYYRFNRNNPVSPNYYPFYYENPIGPEDYRFKYDHPINPDWVDSEDDDCEFNYDQVIPRNQFPSSRTPMRKIYPVKDPQASGVEGLIPRSN